MQTSTYYLKDLLCQIELAWIFCCKIEGSLASLPDLLLLLLFFDWKRHIDLLIYKKKYKKKDDESSRQRKLNYSKVHWKTNEHSKKTTPYGVHTAIQSSCIILRGVLLKTSEQKTQREARKTIESQRYSEFLTLS